MSLVQTRVHMPRFNSEALARDLVHVEVLGLYAAIEQTAMTISQKTEASPATVQCTQCFGRGWCLIPGWSGYSRPQACSLCEGEKVIAASKVPLAPLASQEPRQVNKLGLKNWVEDMDCPGLYMQRPPHERVHTEPTPEQRARREVAFAKFRASIADIKAQMLAREQQRSSGLH